MKYCKGCNYLEGFSLRRNWIIGLFDGYSILSFFPKCRQSIFFDKEQTKDFEIFLDKNKDFFSKDEFVNRYKLMFGGLELLEKYLNDENVFYTKTCIYYFERKVEE